MDDAQPVSHLIISRQPPTSATWGASHSDAALLDEKLRPHHNPLKWYPETIFSISDIHHDVRMRRGGVKIYAQISPVSPDHTSPSTSIDWFSGHTWFDKCIKASRRRDLDNGCWWTGALFEKEYNNQGELSDSYSGADLSFGIGSKNGTNE